MKNKISVLSLAAISLIACSEQKKLNDMHRSTLNMDKTTEGLTQKTDELKGVTDELYDALRQGNAVQLRREAWRSLLEAPTMFKKISEASKYFMSFEYQIWNLNGQDKMEQKRDILLHQATREFFMEIEDLAPGKGAVQITALPQPQDIQSSENRAAAFNAIAFTLDEINRKQELPLAEQPQLKRLSLMSVIDEALRSKSDLEVNANPTDFHAKALREVLLHEEVAIQLLKTRANFLPMVLIDFSSHISQASLAEKVKMAAIGWELDLSRFNSVQLASMKNDLLVPALRARDLLKTIGANVELDPLLIRLFSKMNLKTSQPKIELQNEVELLINQLLNKKASTSGKRP